MKYKYVTRGLFIVFAFVLIKAIFADEPEIPQLLPSIEANPSIQLDEKSIDEVAPLYEEKVISKEEATVGGDDYVSANEPKAQKDVAESQAQVFVSGAKNVYSMMPGIHFLHKPMNYDLGVIAWTNYIKVLDFQRIFFIKEDIDEFEKSKNIQISLLKEGDFSYAINVLEVYRKRVFEYKAFAENYFKDKSAEEYLASINNFSTNEEFLWKRKNALWPENKEAQEKVWEDRLKNQYLAAIINEAIDREKKAAKQSSDVAASQTNEFSTAITDIVTQEFHKKTVDNILKRVCRLYDVMQDLDIDTYKSYFINSFTEAYDPHSSYLSPEKKEDFDIDMGLSLQGIGATLTIDDGMPKIVDIIPGSPADRDISETHLIPGDKIIAVAQGDEEFVDVTHWPLNKAVRLIRGPKDSVVRLKVIPSTDATGTTTKIVTLVRDEIKLEEQAVSYLSKEVIDASGKTRKLGYIHLPSFYSNAASISDENMDDFRSATLDMEKAISELKNDGVEGIVLDLRGNGGGSLPEAISIAGLFIKRGPVVLVKERYRVHKLRDEHAGVAYSGPLVVLIDKLSASASEIVAGTLQDYGRAIIIGDRQTHGKGTVQTIMPLGVDVDNSLGALKVTTASFYRINGSSTQIKGVASDIVLSSVFDYISDLGEDNLPNAIPHTTVRGASYSLVANLEDTIAAVKKLSDARLAKNEKWSKHLAMLECVNMINTNEYASLNYEVRLQEERQNRKATDDTIEDDSNEALFISSSNSSNSEKSEDVDETVKKALEEAAKTPEQRKKEREEQKQKRREKDVVLNESYNIMIDIIDSGLPTGALPEKTSPDLDFILDFFSPAK